MTHLPCALADGARLLQRRHDALRAELGERPSAYADALGLAAALLEGEPLDPAALARIARSAGSPAAATVLRVEAAHRLDLADAIALRRCVEAAPTMTHWDDAVGSAALAADLPDIGEGASAGLAEAAAGARLALRHATRTAGSLVALVRGELPSSDAADLKDLRAFRDLPGALARSRGQVWDARAGLRPLTHGHATGGAGVGVLAASVATQRTTAIPRPALDAGVAAGDLAGMATTVRVSELLLDALALTGVEAGDFVTRAAGRLGGTRARWARGTDLPATADGDVAVTMLRLKDGQLDATVRLGGAFLVSDGDRVAITTDSAPNVVAIAAVGMTLAEVAGAQLLARPGNVVVETMRLPAPDRLMLVVAAATVEFSTTSEG